MLRSDWLNYYLAICCSPLGAKRRCNNFAVWVTILTAKKVRHLCNFIDGDEYGNLTKRKGENFALCLISLQANSCLTTPYQQRCIPGKSLSMYEVVRVSNIWRSRIHIGDANDFVDAVPVPFTFVEFKSQSACVQVKYSARSSPLAEPHRNRKGSSG